MKLSKDDVQVIVDITGNDGVTVFRPKVLKSCGVPQQLLDMTTKKEPERIWGLHLLIQTAQVLDLDTFENLSSASSKFSHDLRARKITRELVGWMKTMRQKHQNKEGSRV